MMEAVVARAQTGVALALAAATASWPRRRWTPRSSPSSAASKWPVASPESTVSVQSGPSTGSGFVVGNEKLGRSRTATW